MAAPRSKTARIKVAMPAVRLYQPKIRAPKLQAPSLKRASRSRNGASKGGPAVPDPEVRALLAERDRLLERFTVMQADLGGAFYEMAIRDHVKMDVLTRKAAELQRLDVELSELEEKVESLGSAVTGVCPKCDTEFEPGSKFCSACGTELTGD
jgi:zinc-ribbon domain